MWFVVYFGVLVFVGDLCFVDNCSCCVYWFVLKVELEVWFVVYVCELFVCDLMVVGVLCGLVCMVVDVVYDLYVLYCNLFVEIGVYCGIVLLVKLLCMLVIYWLVLFVFGCDMCVVFDWFGVDCVF